MKKVFIGIFAAIGLLGYTKLIWQSGFDQGADVSLCVIESMIAADDGHPVSLAETESCRKAKDYESNPLWMLRRRGDVNVQVQEDVAPVNSGIVKNVT